MWEDDENPGTFNCVKSVCPDFKDINYSHTLGLSFATHPDAIDALVDASNDLSQDS